jgi:hypothetical protein
LINSNLQYGVSGDSVSYNKIFTDDPSVIKTNKIAKIDIDVSETFKQNRHSVYFIPNQGKEILHTRPQTTLSSRTISASCIYERPSVNFWTDISYAPIADGCNVEYFNTLTFVKNKMIERALEDDWINVNENESMFISNFNYQVDSNNSLSLTMEIVYEEKD